MSNNAFGIDLGTNNIKIYNRSGDSILVEKNMIAIENKDTLFAYGDSAFEMYEKAPGNIHISYPLSNGVIADIKNMELLVRYFINNLNRRRFWNPWNRRTGRKSTGCLRHPEITEIPSPASPAAR